MRLAAVLTHMYKHTHTLKSSKSFLVSSYQGSTPLKHNYAFDLLIYLLISSTSSLDHRSHLLSAPKHKTSMMVLSRSSVTKIIKSINSTARGQKESEIERGMLALQWTEPGALISLAIHNSSSV